MSENEAVLDATEVQTTSESTIECLNCGKKIPLSENEENFYVFCCQKCKNAFNDFLASSLEDLIN